MKIRFTGIIILTLILGWLSGLSAFAWATTYYVDSQAGSDTNNGLSELFPLKTIAKVNTLLLQPGDSVLFKRGGIWRCPTDDYLSVTSGDVSGVITYGAYGEGDYPLFLGSYNLSNSAEWKNEGNNIWSYGDYATNNIELLSNPSFDTNTSGWSLYVDTSGAQASMARDTTTYDSAPASLKVSITKSGSSGNQIQFYASGIKLIEGRGYALRFKMKATNPFTIEEIGLFKNGSPYTDYYSAKSPDNFTITTQWQTFAVFYVANMNVSDARINFYFGQVVPNNTIVYIDSVSFQQITNDNMLLRDVGNLIFNDEAGVGFKKDSPAGVAAQGDFYYDPANFKLYLYCAYNPGLFYSNIEAAAKRNIIDLSGKRCVLLHNLSLKYGGAHGFGGDSTDNITIRECDISYIGGSYQYDTVRYGNGIEFWENAHDNFVDGCRLWEIYDAALTAQGSNYNSVYNLIFRNNVIWNSEYSFEFWNRPETSNSQDVYFENNTCVNAGGGWGHSQRPDPNGRHLMFYTSEANLSHIFVKNNIFYDATNSLVGWSNINNVPAFILDYNLYYNSYHDLSVEDKGDLARIEGQQYNYPADFVSYQRNTGQDTHSKLGDPLFVDPLQNDYHLKAGSPAIKAGEGGLCIGAYEFVANQASANQPPLAYEQSFTINEDNSLVITLKGTDPENDALTYSVVTLPAHGTLSGTAPKLIYTPNLNYNGSDVFSFKVNDGTSDSSSANVYITIMPVNDPPTTPQGLKATVVSQTQINLTWSASSDPDTGDTPTYNLYRNSSAMPLNTAPITGTSYSDSGLEPNTTYTYQIEAVDNSGAKSAKSTAITGTTTGSVAITNISLNAPANLTATALRSRKIKLSWQDKSNNESGFKIMRSTDGNYLH